nr:MULTISPECIES: hypothetical protein [unclassified Pseudomonas]
MSGFRTQFLNAKDMPNVEKVQAGYKVQPPSSINPRRLLRRRLLSCRLPRQASRPTSSNTCRPRWTMCRHRLRTRRSGPGWPVSAWAPAAALNSKTSRSSTRPWSCSG